jgi:protein gp37
MRIEECKMHYTEIEWEQCVLGRENGEARFRERESRRSWVSEEREGGNQGEAWFHLRQWESRISSFMKEHKKKSGKTEKSFPLSYFKDLK